MFLHVDVRLFQHHMKDYPFSTELPPQLCRKSTACVCVGLLPSVYRSGLTSCWRYPLDRCCWQYSLQIGNRYRESYSFSKVTSTIQIPFIFSVSFSFSLLPSLKKIRLEFLWDYVTSVQYGRIDILKPFSNPRARYICIYLALHWFLSSIFCIFGIQRHIFFRLFIYFISGVLS